MFDASASTSLANQTSIYRSAVIHCFHQRNNGGFVIVTSKAVVTDSTHQGVRQQTSLLPSGSPTDSTFSLAPFRLATYVSCCLRGRYASIPTERHTSYRKSFSRYMPILPHGSAMGRDLPICEHFHEKRRQTSAAGQVTGG